MKVASGSLGSPSRPSPMIVARFSTAQDDDFVHLAVAGPWNCDREHSYTFGIPGNASAGVVAASKIETAITVKATTPPATNKLFFVIAQLLVDGFRLRVAEFENALP